MCSINDQIRRDCDIKIENLREELKNEERKLYDIQKAKGELQQIIDEAQCAINNLGDCNFGGDTIISSVITSQQGYLDRVDYYDEYVIKIEKAKKEIKLEIEEKTRFRNQLPINCGICNECRKVDGEVQ